MLPSRTLAATRALTVGCAVAVVATFEYLFRPYFPNAAGRIAGDYAYYAPRLYDGALWFKENGLLSIPWFTPSFCGGIPAYPNPQSAYYALPQLLDLAFGPLAAIHATAVLFAAIGFTGFYLLLRRTFATGRVAAIFGASLFALDGFYLWRMVAGHLSFHPFTLVPMVAWATLRPLPVTRRGAAMARDACIAGAAIAYAFHAGAVQIAGPAGLAVIAIWALHGVVTGAGATEARAFFLRFAGATCIGAGVAAGKLVSAFAFLSHEQRALYPLPGVRHASDLIELVLVPLLSRPRMSHLGGAIVNTPWTWSISEFELGVGPVPFLLLLVAAIVGSVTGALRLHRGLAPGGRALLVRKLGWALLLAGLLALPLYLNVYSPTLGPFLKTLPLLRSMHTFFRFLSIYVPVVILASALVLDRVRNVRFQAVVAIVGVAVLVMGDRKANAEYRGVYAPGPIVQAHEQLSATGVVPAIERLAPVVMNTGPDLPYGETAAGVSTFPCYEPMFGYALETFPRTLLHAGSALDVTDGAYNLLDASCFVFPGENRCAAGDRLRTDVPDRFATFRAHGPLTFVRPWWQRLADATSLISLGALLFAFFFFFFPVARSLVQRSKGPS